MEPWGHKPCKNIILILWKPCPTQEKFSGWASECPGWFSWRPKNALADVGKNIRYQSRHWLVLVHHQQPTTARHGKISPEKRQLKHSEYFNFSPPAPSRILQQHNHSCCSLLYVWCLYSVVHGEMLPVSEPIKVWQFEVHVLLSYCILSCYTFTLP